MKNKELIREYKKGSKKAFEKLVENNVLEKIHSLTSELEMYT